MAKTIQELRREKGYRNAREFADALDISPSSMSRYDKHPDAIPIKVAWRMADCLGCTIDEVVGRAPVTSGKSDLQEFYDSLHRWNRDLFDEFQEFIRERERYATSLERATIDRKYERLALYYERMFNNGLFDRTEPEALAVLNQPWAIRDGIANLVEEKTEESRWNRARKAVDDTHGAATASDDESVEMIRDELDRMEASEGSVREVTERIMEAYDRLHPEDEYALLRGDYAP